MWTRRMQQEAEDIAREQAARARAREARLAQALADRDGEGLESARYLGMARAAIAFFEAE